MMHDWADVLDPFAARDQQAWERRRMVYRLKRAGLQQKEIARHMGVTNSRVWQMLKKVYREMALGKLSPVEQYLAEDSFDWRTVRDFKRKIRGVI